MIYIDIDGISFGILSHLAKPGELEDNPNPDMPTLIIDKLVLVGEEKQVLIPISFAAIICKEFGSQIFGNSQPEYCEKLLQGTPMQVVIDRSEYGRQEAIH